MRVEAAQKLMALYLNASETPEGQTAGRQLIRMLEESNSTLKALNANYPNNRDLTAMLNWRESLGWLAALETNAKFEALTQLVDATDLSKDERHLVLTHLSLPTLAASRLHGWSHVSGIDVRDFEAILPKLRDEDVLNSKATTIALALQEVANQHAWNHEHPWRELKATDEIQAHFLLGLVQAFTNREGNIVKHQDGLRVRAALSAQELSQLRSAQTNHQQELPELLNQTAFNFAKKVAQNINLK